MPGANSTRQGHLDRARRIAQSIERRFGIRSHRCWQLKHIEWLLQTSFSQYAPATRRDYERTVRIIIDALGKSADWLPRLKGLLTPAGAGGRKLGLVSGRPGARRPVKGGG